MAAPDAESVVTADDWKRAVDEVEGWYPSDVFTEAGRTLDGISGTMARRVCQLIRITAAANALERPEPSDGSPSGDSNG